MASLFPSAHTGVSAVGQNGEVQSANPPHRIIFLDIDGTIQEHGSVVAPSTVTAIRAARANGHLVYVCTGRSGCDIAPDVAVIGFDGAITDGGAYVRRGDEVVIANPMPRAQVQVLIDYFEREALGFFLQSDAVITASEDVIEHIAEFAGAREEQIADERSRLGLGPGTAAGPVSAEDFAHVRDADLDLVTKAVFVGDRTDLVERTRDALGHRFHVVKGSMPLPGGTNGEISMLGTTKGAAITELLAILDRSPAEAIGIGDSWNDVEMFEVCGVSVAMGNADPALQARADRVTTSVLDDGIHRAFVELGLIDA